MIPNFYFFFALSFYFAFFLFLLLNFFFLHLFALHLPPGRGCLGEKASRELDDAARVVDDERGVSCVPTHEISISSFYFRFAFFSFLRSVHCARSARFSMTRPRRPWISSPTPTSTSASTPPKVRTIIPRECKLRTNCPRPFTAIVSLSFKPTFLFFFFFIIVLLFSE